MIEFFYQFNYFFWKFELKHFFIGMIADFRQAFDFYLW